MRLAQSVPWMCFVGLLTAASPSEAQPKGGASPRGAGQQGAAGQTAIQAPRAPGEAMSDKARKLYMEGVTASEKGRWADAYASFVAAWALQKHYTIAGGIGTCELMLQRYPDAAKHLAIYVREIEKDTTATPEERAAALKTYAQARAKVGAVKLHVNVEDAEVRVGQEVVGTVPLEDPVFLEPGAHTISVRRQGYEPASVEVELKAGEEIERSVELKSARPSEGPVGERPKSPGQGTIVAHPVPGPNKTLLIAGGAAAGVGLIAGTVLTILYFGKAGDAEALRQDILSGSGGAPERYCPNANSPPICAELNDTVDVQYVFANVAVGSFIVGAAGVGTMIYALVDRPSVPDRRVQVAPLVGSGVTGLSLNGRF
ncbi:PEGA domain-containing protein [Sorangium sp. So ce185]|uniref:PEGA domain-containing protein n=1 Tax=Sorangium sp. So ce185 TaxID=3133287 RepID=UPI003F62D309